MSWAEACVFIPPALLELYRELRGASEAPYVRYGVERRRGGEGTHRKVVVKLRTVIPVCIAKSATIRLLVVAVKTALFHLYSPDE